MTTQKENYLHMNQNLHQTEHEQNQQQTTGGNKNT